MPNYGFAHLCHHDTHYEWCYDYAERVAYITAHKPEEERAVRLRQFRILTTERLPGAINAAWVDADAAWANVNAAWANADADAAWVNAAWADAYAAWANVNAAWANADADAAWVNAYAALCAYMASPEGIALHAELFPDCPWDEDQRTMFPLAGMHAR